MKKVYISGSITNDPNYAVKFESAAEHYRGEGHLVMNPAILPFGFAWDDYMPICIEMMKVCDTIALLPCYTGSKGAMVELVEAERLGLDVVHFKH